MGASSGFLSKNQKCENAVIAAGLSRRNWRKWATHDNPLRQTLHWDCNAHNLADDGYAGAGDMIAGGFAEDGGCDGTPGDAEGSQVEAPVQGLARTALP